LLTWRLLLLGSDKYDGCVPFFIAANRIPRRQRRPAARSQNFRSSIRTQPD
jgi:hypothetical protein